VALYDKEFPNGDQGGNLIKLTYKDKQLNLHSFWDDGAFVWPYVKRPLTAATTSTIEKYA